MRYLNRLKHIQVGTCFMLINKETGIEIPQTDYFKCIKSNTFISSYSGKKEFTGDDVVKEIQSLQVNKPFTIRIKLITKQKFTKRLIISQDILNQRENNKITIEDFKDGLYISIWNRIGCNDEKFFFLRSYFIKKIKTNHIFYISSRGEEYSLWKGEFKEMYQEEWHYFVNITKDEFKKHIQIVYEEDLLDYNEKQNDLEKQKSLNKEKFEKYEKNILEFFGYKPTGNIVEFTTKIYYLYKVIDFFNKKKSDTHKASDIAVLILNETLINDNKLENITQVVVL